MSHFDVIVIGGSFAGLSAALMMGRMLKTVLVIDAGQRCNLKVKESHSFLTHDGQNPADLILASRTDLKKYPNVVFMEGIVNEIKKSDATNTVSFEVHVESVRQQTFTSRRLLFATGVRDILPKIPGFEECWAISIFNCPFCHGYEEKNKRLAVLGDNSQALFMVTSLLMGLTEQITILTNGQPCSLDETTKNKLTSKNVQIIEDEIASIEHKLGQISSIHFKNSGTSILVDAVFAHCPTEQSCKLPENLGCEVVEPLGHLKRDQKNQTTIPGIYAAGDCASPIRQLSVAISEGSMSGAWICMDLSMIDLMA